jgi:hypothetical protein
MQAINAEVAARCAVYAMASSNAYHQPPRKSRHPKMFFPIHRLGWTLVTPDSVPIALAADGRPAQPTHESSLLSLAFDIHERGGDTIFAFRGTDDVMDYVTGSLGIAWSLHYARARQHFVRYARRNPARRIVLTGHSLGGGLALSASVRRDVLEEIRGALPAGAQGYGAVVFNTSPRVFDGWGDRHVPAQRTAIYQDGEVLEHVRRLWERKFNQVVAPHSQFETRFDYQDKCGQGDLKDASHRADLLADGLLRLGVTADPSLQPVLDGVLPA